MVPRKKALRRKSLSKSINVVCPSRVALTTPLGHSMPTSLENYLNLLQTYQLELDVESAVGRLPRCFVREFGQSVSEYVVLRDPNHNEFEVHVVKKSGDVYFDEGWVGLRDVYDVCFGAWVAVTYVSPSLLTIRLLSRWGAEVRYPCYDPPLRHLLAKAGPSCLLESSVSMLSSSGPSRTNSLVRSYVKEITPYDVQSGTLVLPYHSFGQSAFAFVFSDLILVDSVGAQYKCRLKFGVDAAGEMACNVSGGWTDLCVTHGVVQGDRVKFSVAHYSATNVMYVSVYPRVLAETHSSDSSV